jgi:hypothetical protein
MLTNYEGTFMIFPDDTRTNYIEARMADVPKAYQGLLPASSDLRQLAAAEQEIRSQMQNDFRTFAPPNPSPLQALQEALRESTVKSLPERQTEAGLLTQAATQSQPATPANAFQLLLQGLRENPIRIV